MNLIKNCYVIFTCLIENLQRCVKLVVPRNAKIKAFIIAERKQQSLFYLVSSNLFFFFLKEKVIKICQFLSILTRAGAAENVQR